MVEYIVRVDRRQASAYAACFEAPTDPPTDRNGIESLTCTDFPEFLKDLKKECGHLTREGYGIKMEFGTGLAEPEISAIRCAIGGNEPRPRGFQRIA